MLCCPCQLPFEVALAKLPFLFHKFYSLFLGLGHAECTQALLANWSIGTWYVVLT